MNDSNDLPCSPPGGQAAADVSGRVASSDVEDVLDRAQKLATVGQLTSGVAHEFNNLLQGIVGSLEVVRKLVGLGRGAETDRFTAAALSSARRAAALTGRLLDFARPGDASEPGPVDVNDVIASMADLLRAAQRSTTKIECTPAAGLWTALCDPQQLENAIVNLVVHARDAMPDGGTIVLATANADLSENRGAPDEIAAGQYVCIEVSDSGPAIGPEAMTSAFDPFSSHADARPGSGLCLWMVHRFAKEAGGYTRIESEADRGTTVRLYLPRHPGE